MLKVNDKVPTKLSGILVYNNENNEIINKKVSLSSLYKDKPLVLYFYPKDMTPGCNTEACNFKENYQNFLDNNINLIGCSRDNELRHEKFINKFDLPFPLLFDNTGEITESFGVWQERKNFGKIYMGIARSTFIINKKKILEVFPKVKVKEHYKEILEIINNL